MKQEDSVLREKRYCSMEREYVPVSHRNKQLYEIRTGFHKMQVRHLFLYR